MLRLVLRSRQANCERKTRGHWSEHDDYTDLFPMAHEKSPFLDSVSDESFNSLTRGDTRIIHPAGEIVCFTDNLPERYNCGSANINLPV
jgi:hypothetical protein